VTLAVRSAARVTVRYSRHGEATNLTIRNAFSKKPDNHKAVLTLYFMHYTFARTH
jgi:hypothetical protein